MASPRKLLLLSAIIACTVAVPLSPKGQCARYCTDESDFLLRPGSTYTYDYETTTLTTVQTASQDKTQLQMTAQVDIEVLSKCELSMRLRKVALKVSDPESPDYLVSSRGAREFAKTIERTSLRFSYQNGRVEHVCPSEEVPTWVTNIQKGVLSAFQTTKVKSEWPTRTIEVDILGKCEAEYQSLGTSWQGTHTVRKQKDLTTCSDRENVESFLQGTPYAQDGMQKSLPVVSGHQDCEQVTANSFLQISTCNEKLILRPFSNRGNGVVTTVSQKLVYATTSERKFTGDDYRPTTESLLYTHATKEIAPFKIEEETEKILVELCEAGKDDVSMFVPRTFSALVYKLKKLPYDTLKTLYAKSEKMCPEKKARKFFMDAVPLASTVDSARFMYEMISRKAIPETESSYWLAALSFVTDVTPHIIKTFTPLLNGRFENAPLGVSALIRNYCKDKDCSNVPEVRGAIELLAANLKEKCVSHDEKMVILSLKAIGNVGYLFGKESLLESCYKNPQIRTETRLAAIEAFRRTSCDISRDDLLRTYGNYNEDTEIRIAAYLAVMKCANPSTVQAIKDIMMEEKINHVGSFIWTHLNALSKSRHPERREIREIISNLYLMNKFASDARKFSTAHEANFYLQSIDSGIHVDSHLIFSTDSFLPRTAMFNLTVDVFGRSCNLFQIDGRMEGMEHFVESFFGPGGYFPQKNVARILRERRSMDNSKLNTIDGQYNEYKNVQEPYGSVDVKVFGTSMWYNQFKNADGSPDITLLNIVTQLAEEKEQEYSRSFMFLDTTFTVPMASGLPLKIALNGTASVALKIGGKFDVKSFEHIDVLGHIEPSGAIEISSLLTVGVGNVARSGMRVISTLHSSSVLDGKVQVRNGEVVKAQLNMPRERIDVLNVQSKVFLVHGNQEREKSNDDKYGTHLESCTGETASKIFGVKLCSELELPAGRPNTPLHPLNGPARLNLFIQKTDPTLKSYNFDAQWKSDLKNSGFIRHGIFSLNTPESSVDRDVKMELYLNQADHTATLKIKTPVKKLSVSAKLLNTATQKKMSFGVNVDDKDLFSLESDLGMVSDKNAVTYTPSLEIRIPSRRLVGVSGMAELKYGQRYTGQLQIEDLTERPILAKGNVEIGKRDRYDMEFSLSSYPLDGTLKGYAQLGDSMSSRFSAEYRILESKMNKLTIVGKMRNLSANALTKYTGQLNVQASALPEWNTDLYFETMRTTGHEENSITVSLGDGVRSRKHTIKVEEILKYEGSLSNNKIEGSLHLTYPEKNVDYGFAMTHENTENSLKNSMKIQYDKKSEIVTDVQLKADYTNLINVAGDIKLKYPGREAGITVDLTQSSNKEYRTTLSCQWQTGQQAGVVLHYKDKCDSSRLKYEVDGNINLPDRSPITFGAILGHQGGQFVGSSEVSMGRDKYRAKVDYSAGNGMNHRLTGQLILRNDVYALETSVSDAKEKLIGNLEMKMPQGHRATAKFEGRMSDTITFGSFETFWDIDRDASKHFKITGELGSRGDGYDGSIFMEIHRRIVKGSFTTSLQGTLFSSVWKTNNKFDLMWSPVEKISGVFSTNVVLDRSRQQLNSHVELITPYRGYQNTTISATHLYSNQQWDSELSTLLPWGKDLTLSSSGKYSFARGAIIDTKARMTSSYQGFEELYFAITHDQNSKEFSNRAELKWGPSKRLAYEITGVKQSSVLRGSLQVSTPFANIREISSQISHVFKGGNSYKTQGHVQWSPSKKIIFNVETNHELSGRRRIGTCSFEGSFPFRGYENTAMKFIYTNDGVNINTEAETTWSRNKISTSLSLSNRNQANNRNLEGKFSFMSPFQNYENIQISTSCELLSNAYKFNIDTKVPYQSTASINSQGKLIDINDIEFNAVVIGNFPRIRNVQRASVDFVHKFQKSKLRTTLDTSYGNDRLTVLFIGLTESEYNARNSEFSATVNTPFRDFEELKTDFTYNQRGNEYFTKLQMNKNKQGGSLLHKLNIRDILNFDTSLELTSTAGIPNSKISITQASNGRQLEHTSFIQWDEVKKIQLNAMYLDKTFLKEINVKVSTPFRTYKDLELKASMECQDRQHKGVISFVWDKKNKMTLGADIKNYRWESMDSQLEITSPFKGYEFYSTSLKYDFTAMQKEVEFSYMWDMTNRKAVLIKGNFLSSQSLVNLETTITTPFEDFKHLALSTKYENASPQKNLYIRYERDWRKIHFNGMTMFTNNAAEITLDYSSPYKTVRELKAVVKYNGIRNGLKGEVETQWNRDKYRVNAQYELTGSSGKGSIEVSTPLENYEKIIVDIKGSNRNSRMDSELKVKLHNGQEVVINVDMYPGRESGNFNMKLQSSFRSLREFTLNTNYKAQSGVYEMDFKSVINKRDTYKGSWKGIYGGSHLAEIQMALDTPITSLENVQWFLSVDSNAEMKGLMSTLKWENEEITFRAMLVRKIGQFYEAKIDFRTPIEGLRVLSFDSSLRKDKNNFMDGRINIETPFEILRKFNAYGEFKNDDSGYFISLKAETPQKVMEVTGKMSNNQFRPLIASVTVKTPFTSFKTIETKLVTSIPEWNNAEAKLSVELPSSTHYLTVNFKKDDELLDFETKVESPSLPNEKAIATFKADYKDNGRISSESSLEVLGEVHYLRGQYKNSGRNVEAQVDIESPLLKEGQAKMLAKLSRHRRDKSIDAQINFGTLVANHQVGVKYENKGSEISTNLKIDSNLTPFSSLEAQGKYINVNGRDLEASLSLTTPEASHTITGSLKNYEDEKYAQLRIACPMITNPITITGTFKHGDYRSVDGSLSISTPRKEVRIAGNMKNEGWQNIEGFLTVNTPFEALKMVRLDGRFRNDRYQSIDSSFQIETSNANFQSLGLTSKLSRMEGSEEMSLMLRLPTQNFRQVQLLGNVHYNSDFSEGDSRITFTVPDSKYVVYGQYGVTKSRVSGRGEVEMNGVRYSVNGRLDHNSDKKDIVVSFNAPHARTYTFGGMLGNYGNQRQLAVSYNTPSDERYILNSSLAYENPKNFAADFQIETPFYSYRNLQGKIQQKVSHHSMSTDVEYYKNGRKGFLKMYHRNQRDGVRGAIQIGCPYTQLKDARLSYNQIKKNSNVENSIELDYNRAKQFKLEAILFGERSSHIVLDVPVLPLTMTADSKKLTNGRESSFKSNYLSRVVTFRTSHQFESRQILHDAAFSWDERADKRVSYDFKFANTGSGNELWGRLDTPIRSLMLKGNFTKTTRSRSGGVDFYWDAARSLEKHVGFGAVYADISTDKQTSHKLEINMEHPKLEKDLVQTNILSYSPSEVHLKSELQYSRDRSHNLVMELRGNDLSKGRDSHYKGEFYIRHPASRLDIRGLGEVVDSRLESNAFLRLNTVDRHQTQNVRELKTKIMKLRQEIEVMMRSNGDKTRVYGQATGRGGDYDIALESENNDVKHMTARIKYSRRNRALDVSILNKDDTGLHVSAAYPKESASLKISHSARGNQVTDAHMFLGLEESKVLKTRLNWRPRLMEDLRIVTGETLRGIIRSSQEGFRTLRTTIAEECSTRISLMSRAMSDLMAPFLEDMRVGVDEIQQDLRITSDSLRGMYYRNEFLMRDIASNVDTIKQVAREVANGIVLGCEVLCNITMDKLDDIYYQIYYSFEDLSAYMQALYSEMFVKIESLCIRTGDIIKKGFKAFGLKLSSAAHNSYMKMQQWKDIMILKLDKWIRSYAPCIIDGYYYTKHAADKIRYSINGFTTTVTDCIMANRYFVALRNYAQRLLTTFDDLQQMAISAAEKVYSMQLLDYVLNHPSLDYVSDVTNSVLRKGVEVYHNVGMDAIMSSAADTTYNYLKTMTLNAAHEYLAEFYHSKAGAKYDFEPERGLLTMEINLPAPRSSLMEVFDYSSYPEYKKLIDINSVALAYYEDFCIWDVYYKFVKYFTPSYWMPTFSAHALISGNQHFITFDKLAYDFAGKCSYLLARDFDDGNFTAIVNYGSNDHTRRSLTILVDGRKVDIGNDYKITLDNSKAELPIQIGRTVFIREGSNVRVENEKKGFSIVCNFIHNYCSVSLSSFYFGKTAGLFGTFNYEPRLDMMTPTRYVVDDVESFTKSWEVGQTVCSSSENFATLPSNSYRVNTKCKDLFQKSNSEFRACFKQVNPSTYLKMCISDLSAVHEDDHDKALCQSAAAYFVECKTEGVALKMPKHCVRCEKQDGSYMTEGDAIQYPRDGTVSSADVVFLVEEKECNRNKARHLSKLAQTIEDNYRQKGFKDIRYSVVGFGGDQVHSAPHVHTLDGKESGPLRSLDSALESLEYGDGPVNILEAVRFAAALTYRPGTAKSFVLVKCSTCKSEEVRAEYSEMLRTLMDGDITLHLLMEQNYEMKIPNKNAKARRVIGVDKKFAYTLKDVKDSRLSGDGDLLAQLRIPKDVCIPLAFEVNGTSFDSQMLTETRKNTNKKFMDVLARLVVKSSAAAGTTEWGMCCECLATEDGVGQSTCQRCVSEEMASMISADIFSVSSPSNTQGYKRRA